MIRLAVFALVLSSASAFALDAGITGASVNRSESSPADSVRLPNAPWSPETSVSEVEGAIRRTAYRVPDPTRTTLQLITPLRNMLEQDGYRLVFACADTACGGFDFRFQLDLLPEPDMHVDLGNFRYVLMEKPGAEPHTVSLVASVSATSGFLHVTEVSDAVLRIEDSATMEMQEQFVPEPVPDGIVDALKASGRAVLADLEFAVGSTDLGVGPYSSLEALADWLEVNPSARIVLVGHTDAVGSLEANTTLSQRRAAAVVDRLVSKLGVDPAQLQSAGAGFLSPVATNLTNEGRAANRRVEVVLLDLD